MKIQLTSEVVFPQQPMTAAAVIAACSAFPPEARVSITTWDDPRDHKDHGWRVRASWEEDR